MMDESDSVLVGDKLLLQSFCVTELNILKYTCMYQLL